MSLSRLALRLAAIEVLAPYAQHQAADPVWPTFAGRKIYDSQITARALSEVEAKRPMIVVYTDEDKTAERGTAQEVTVAGDGKQVATLAFEIQVPIAMDDATLAPFGPTDAMAEAILDMIEEQILQRLGEGRTTRLLDGVLLAIEAVESNPYRDPDTDIRLSARRLELSCHVRQRGAWPAPGAEAMARLPEPLRSVAAELPAGSYGHQVATALSELIGNPALFPDLNEIRLAANIARGPGDTPAAPPNAAPTPPVGDLGASITL